MIVDLIRSFVIKLLYIFLKKKCKTNNAVYSSIIIIAPHPDDEIFGAGGLIIKQLQNNTKIAIIYLTDGEGSGVWPDREEIKKQRIALSGKVLDALGITSENIYRLHLPDGRVPFPGQPGFNETVSSLNNIFETFKPEVVFATHPLDYWPFDHVACSQIAYEAVKRSVTNPQLWCYWVWAWYNIRPWQSLKVNFRHLRKVNITKQLQRKKELIGIYTKGLSPDGKPWGGILPNSLRRSFNNDHEVIERSF